MTREGLIRMMHARSAVETSRPVLA